MSKYLRKRWGEQVENPSEADMRAALTELQKPDGEHPDCSLSTEKGWSLSVFQSGLAVLENVATGEGPWHIRSIDLNSALAMWQLVMNDELEQLRNAQEWRPGYG